MKCAQHAAYQTSPVVDKKKNKWSAHMVVGGNQLRKAAQPPPTDFRKSLRFYNVVQVFYVG